MTEFTVLQSSRHAQNLIKALAFAEDGWPVIPLHSIFNNKCTCGEKSCSSPGKHPLTKNGSKDASTDELVIKEWWIKFPFANIGLSTGSRSSLVVLDVDKIDSLKELEKEHGELIGHTEVLTGRGGKHFYFQAPKELLSNKVSIVDGIDFRGEGGYVVAPPSKHISGNDYRWIRRSQLQSMPEWLLKILLKKRVPVTSSIRVNSGTGILQGARNSTLASFAGFFKAKGLNDEQIRAILPHVNKHACNPPLLESEVLKITQSIARYESWQEIIPLPTLKSVLVPMDINDIPHPLKSWVADVCERMQLPLEFIAAPAIVAISSMIGRKLMIKPLRYDDWVVIPNLWGILVADPGSMKSAAMTQAMKPIIHLEKKARGLFQKQCQEHAKREKDISLEIDCIKQSIKLDWSQGLGQNIQQKKEHLKRLTENERTVLKEKRHKTNDPTIEKLADILKDNPQGILLLRDELSGWLESLSKTGREGSREFYLEAWNGNGSFSIDRIGRGSTFTESICLSIFGGIQPEKLQKYMDKFESSHGQDGFLERFQIAVYPEPLKNWKLIDRKPNEEALQKVFNLFEMLDEIQINEKATRSVMFSEDAQIRANDWRTYLEKKLIDPDLSDTKKSHLSKYRSLMPSLALIFEVIEKNAIPDSVSIESTALAIKWSEILESHMCKILNMGCTVELITQSFLNKIKSGEIFDGQRVRDIYRKSWKGMTTPEKTNAILIILEKHHYIRRVKETGLGGSSEYILINPSFGGGV